MTIAERMAARRAKAEQRRSTVRHDNKLMRARRAKAGRCLDCEAPAVAGKSRCQAHLDKHAQWSRSYYKPKTDRAGLRWREAARLRANGLSWAEVGKRMGTAGTTAASMVRMGRERERIGRIRPQGETVSHLEKIEARLTALGRCACGLMNPCLNYLPSSAAELEELRAGAGDVYPEPGL